jgi:hypothetical protein
MNIGPSAKISVIGPKPGFSCLSQRSQVAQAVSTAWGIGVAPLSKFWIVVRVGTMLMLNGRVLGCESSDSGSTPDVSGRGWFDGTTRPSRCLLPSQFPL